MRASLSVCVVGLLALAAGAAAAPVAVKVTESVTHGFLLLRTEQGETLAEGELEQAVHGDRVESRVVFRFKDGSVFDESVTFSQRRVFRLLSITGVILKNLPPGASAKGHFVAFTPRPQMLDTRLREEGEDRYDTGDSSGALTRYLVKTEIGGLTGVVAGLLGKTPPDGRYWFTKGAAKGFVKFEGAMFLNGPKWRIELGGPRWSP